jgi:hypothetical protein
MALWTAAGRPRVSIYKKRYELIIQPKREFFKPETGKRHDLLPEGRKMKERKESAPQNGSFPRPSFSGYFPAFFLFTFAFWEKRGIL